MTTATLDREPCDHKRLTKPPYSTAKVHALHECPDCMTKFKRTKDAETGKLGWEEYV